MADIPDLGMSPQAVLPVSQLENIAKLAAEHAVERGIERFLERAGIDPDDMANLRKDFASMRSSREIKEAIVKQGFLAVMTILLGGIGTAVMFFIKGGGVK
ncbi:hypothetical protein [Microvirga tunisiensis]|uniref:Uncharacterized protein n=1 Tax=Microvirga tunisiensis TaxID=2108360 RepID=A0A5N7MTH2_9HYPH|nr:hypothetical protein [Microvirga tunisiensis]MPR12359.1 hypothetical protein [Microvirga tunisiensis]MPR30291.1 hypothetical protein [Microvirga tunisiensis]